MRNPSSIFSFSRENPLAGLLLFAIAVLIIETALAFLPQNALITALGTNRLPDRSPDWQIMGDSVAEGGIPANQLAEKLPSGTSVANVALSASGPEFPYFILKREIASGTVPKAIIYAPSPHTFGTKRIALLAGAYATWPEITEIATAGIDPFEVLYGVICKLSASLRHREHLAALMKGRRMAPDGERPAATESGPPESKNNAPSFTLDRVHPMYRKRFDITPFNLHFARKFLAEAKARDIPIYWVVMPVLEVIHEVRKPYQFDENYTRFLNDIQGQYGVTLIIPRGEVLPPENFMDYAHLNPRGAALFTQKLAEQLKSVVPQK